MAACCITPMVAVHLAHRTDSCPHNPLVPALPLTFCMMARCAAANAATPRLCGSCTARRLTPGRVQAPAAGASWPAASAVLAAGLCACHSTAYRSSEPVEASTAAAEGWEAGAGIALASRPAMCMLPLP